jgi:hypothetical protein
MVLERNRLLFNHSPSVHDEECLRRQNLSMMEGEKTERKKTLGEAKTQKN